MREMKPITVWMVHLGRDQADRDIKGSLAIQEGALTFSDPASGADLSFPFGTIQRAKRLRASPVLMLEWGVDGESRRTAFYFIQPPPLKPPEPGTVALPGDPFNTRRRTGPLGSMRSGKRRHVKSNVHYLQTTGIKKKDLIQAWVDAVNAGRAGG
jgi:hypothetical protein